MKQITSLKEMSQHSRKIKDRGQSIGFVPTMGTLHEGHLSLIDAAKKKCDVVIISIFINPLQFSQSEDLKKYPRNLKKDKNTLKSFDPIILFTPSEKDLLPHNSSAVVDVEGLSKKLCGKSRPGHFRGVATIITKLFNIIRPDHVFLGEKDFQQQIIIKKLVKDLNYNIEVTSVKTLREYDGLAFSSRNTYFNERERKAAPILYKTLLRAKEAIEAGERDPRRLHYIMAQHVGREPIAKIDYVGLCDPSTLDDVKTIKGDILLAVAAHIGHTRLIDNMVVHAK
ncbi:MAG: pantoate--beta-alanine ligase [Candidatus Saganbacteria bacterium]|nr:pantoate--beta-alanine ligase [Candidatus Saganbacteria bacterium]